MATLSKAALQGSLVINALFYAEVSVTFDTADELDEALPPGVFRARAAAVGGPRSSV